MRFPDLQSVLVHKDAVSSRDSAYRIARRYIGESRAAPKSIGRFWEFASRPKEDFVKGSFRGTPLVELPGVILLRGKLKRAKNPGDQMSLPFRGGSHKDRVIAEMDFWLTMKSKLAKVKSKKDIKEVISDYDARDIKSVLVRGLIESDIASKARALKLSKMPPSVYGNEIVVKILRKDRTENPGKKRSSKSGSKKSPSYIKLKSPKKMPDPGPCSWLGSLIEFAWFLPNGGTAKKVDEKGNAIWTPRGEWMFMWSPKYKAVVCIKRPRDMYKLAKVSRYGGAAKMFEVFADRPAENTFEVTVPDAEIAPLGKGAAHIVYRSDKWSPQRKTTDYIHDFGKNVNIYCGPSIENPEVFICFGGKLTLTKRGLVW